MTDAVDAMIERDVAVNGDILAFADTFKGVTVTWGMDDCSMFAAQWAADRLGRDFLFNPYDSEAEARALIENSGGLVHVWQFAADANGIHRVADRPQAGDVGVVDTFALGPVGCIFMKYGSVAVLRTDPGYRVLGIREKHVLGAWRIP